ncbi:DNA/RNA non-specific endonuclease [Chryseobacterium sp. APV1]|uniref:DNA/RNA non-specific endonuclease n=1 Tax=Chryseobacterium urinae TaxID=3058400 RepID=A0ABT8U633_9FLAO|nr:DNA/RNA non-specific endonuclease [Chryseobacterium sp. APV1]MDO3425530.1 DNA/RNA non-specific endonuclease [Chryseobacterium sp. APV1]
MKSKMLFQGYDENFILNKIVSLPKLNEEQINDVVRDKDGNDIIKYINYSLQLSATHKFPFYTATNINGLLFKKVPRKDNWRNDDRVEGYQWGKELYSAPKSNFDRGHMTKREDVQWGETIGIALNAADSTFYYTNAVPQHKDLNRDIWRSLEDYILHTETKQNELRVCVFTGPVLSRSNPYFVTPINDKQIQIPSLFWKVVVFQKEDGNLYRVGFMMSQNKLLSKNAIIEELESDNELFMQFDDADTYQVNISLIEDITGLEIPKAIDSYSDERSLKLILKEIDIDPDLESDSIGYKLGFSLENIVL